MTSQRHISLAALSIAAWLGLFLGMKPTAHGESPAKEQVVPLRQEKVEKEPPFWSKEAKLISYRCKDLKLEARSRISPSVTFNLSTGLFNEKDCKETVKNIETKGCFCDDGLLKCLEQEKIEPVGIICPTGFICFEFRGKKTGIIKVKDIGNHFTRQACSKELVELERD